MMSAGNQACIGKRRMLRLAEIDTSKEQIPEAEARATNRSRNALEHRDDLQCGVNNMHECVAAQYALAPFRIKVQKRFGGDGLFK